MKKILSILLICILLNGSVQASEHKVKQKLADGLNTIKDAVIFVLEIPLMIIALPFACAMFSNDNPNK